MKKNSNQLNAAPTEVVVLEPNDSPSSDAKLPTIPPSSNLVHAVNSRSVSDGSATTQVHDVSFWKKAHEPRRTVIKRNCLILLFFYVPIIGFYIGAHYLAKFLAVEKPKAWMRREPSKRDMIIYYSVVAGFTMLLCAVTLKTIFKHRSTPVIQSKLPSFTAHISFCLLVIPPLTYVTNMVTIHYGVKNSYIRFIQALELMIVGQVWAALSNRMAIMYLLLAKGICIPSYKLFLAKAILMSLIFQVVPYIIAMTVSFPKYTDLIKWCAVTYVMVTLIEMTWYTVKMHGGFVKLFVDYENVVRMMVMQAVILVVSMCMFQFERHGRAFYRFNASMVLVWQLVFEMFGDLLWNEIAWFCGTAEILIDENTLISLAYDLIDPRGRLDLLMQDEELYPILLATARRRYMDENFRFMKDVRKLKKEVEAQFILSTRKQESKSNGDNSSLTLGVLDNYIVTGAPCPVNLPSRIIGPLRAMRKKIAEQSASMCQVESEMQNLLWAAYSEIALLIHQSQVLSVFSKNLEVCTILKGRIDRFNTLCGTDAKLIAPPQRNCEQSADKGNLHSVYDVSQMTNCSSTVKF